MKKIFLIVLCSVFLVGCTSSMNNAKKSIELYFQSYNNLSDAVLKDLDAVANSESLSDNQKSIYKEVLKRQYRDLKYVINSESYQNDQAKVNVTIEVYDLYYAQKEAESYLKRNISMFNDERGVFNNSKYIDYKLNMMNSVNKRISYSLDFLLVRENDLWVLDEVTPSNLAKIHGIYNYDFDY